MIRIERSKALRRVQSFVARELRGTKDSVEVWHLSDLVQELERVGNVLLFGGAVREAILGNARHFSSDLDLVVDTQADIARISLPITGRLKQNKFGGYRFWVGGRSVDLWRLSTTWAFANKLVAPASAENLPKTTFFSWDAIAYDVSRRKLIASENYFSLLSRNLVELNLAENPNPLGALQRVLRIVEERQTAIGPRLAAYLRSALSTTPISAIALSGPRDTLRGKQEWIERLAQQLEIHAQSNPKLAFRIGVRMAEQLKLGLALGEQADANERQPQD